MQRHVSENQGAFQLVYYHALLFVIEMLVILLVIFGVAHLCQLSYHFCYEVFGPVSAEEVPGEDKEFTVRDSDTMFQVAKRLEAKKLIKNKYSFYVRGALMNQENTGFVPGRYVLNTSMDYEEIINELRNL